MAEQEQGTIDEVISAQMPGPSVHEQYFHGDEYAQPGLESDMSALPPGGVGIGAESRVAGMSPSNNGGVQPGMDSMAGLPLGSIPNQGYPTAGSGQGGIDSTRGLAAAPQAAPLGEQDSYDSGPGVGA
jgi:hypothetical protein